MALDLLLSRRGRAAPYPQILEAKSAFSPPPNNFLHPQGSVRARSRKVLTGQMHGGDGEAPEP